MTFDEAKTRLIGGAEFGDVFPHLPEAEGLRLKHWYTGDSRLPALKERASRNGKHVEPTGDVCSVCGGLLVRTGTCLTCQVCGSTTGGCS